MKRDINRSNYTMIEILTVVGLLAFLMGIGIAGYSIATSKAQESQTRAIIEEMGVALEAYKAQNGVYPQQNFSSFEYVDQSHGGKVMYELHNYLSSYSKWKQTGIISSAAGYLLYDSYGNKIKYRCPGTHNKSSYDLWSAGPDGDFTTTDDNITNWNK